MDERRPLIWQQALLTAAAAAAVWYPQKLLGAKLGLYSTLISEMLLLLLTFLYVRMTGGRFRDAFRIKRPTGRAFFGSIVVYLGGYLAILALTLLMAYLFPEKYFSVSEGLSEAIFGTGIPVWAALMIATVSPAVCEEAFARGSFGYSLRGCRKWIVIVVSAAVFGALHMDPIRFVPTSILGAMFMLIYLETDNILYPMTLHFINNAVSGAASLASAGGGEAVVLKIPLMSVGAYFIITALSPFVIRGGVRLLKPKESQKLLTYTAPQRGVRTPSDPAKRLAVIVALIFAISGALMISSDQKLKSPAFTYTDTLTVAPDETAVLDVTFRAESTTVYAFRYDMSISRGIGTMYVTDETGENLGQIDFRDTTSGVSSMMLEEGTYHIIVEAHVADVWEYCAARDLGYSKDADLVLLGMNVPEDEDVEISVDFEIH
ncbi:MAG: CPBP family intramembrane metalloprotease [Eubacteriaceae bacterium]|nr:CPBP family intramembrane metalloprotease [Eubacteriaceae bacterium]